jgi:hypothetical protein
MAAVSESSNLNGVFFGRTNCCIKDARYRWEKPIGCLCGLFENVTVACVEVTRLHRWKQMTMGR